jgi:hypothetical protein
MTLSDTLSMSEDGVLSYTDFVSKFSDISKGVTARAQTVCRVRIHRDSYRIGEVVKGSEMVI